MFQKYSEGVSDIDKQIYADALQQTKNNELKRVNNSQGERMYKVLLTTWSIAAVIIVVIISFLYITSLKGSIQGFKDRENENVKLIKSIEMGHDLAVKIMTRNYWYILNDEYISSEPDGCGEIIKLDQTLKPARSRMSVKNPEKNIKIYFFFKPWYVVRHYDEWYSMAFGFLWYIY
ncbi:MAG: hypothetical protein NTY12_05670 [Candidatus Falkowbacteria bacterium]|nr:hypothetical protein [Candidatus Falkowbacteria bacterium]